MWGGAKWEIQAAKEDAADISVIRHGTMNGGERCHVSQTQGRRRRIFLSLWPVFVGLDFVHHFTMLTCVPTFLHDDVEFPGFSFVLRPVELLFMMFLIKEHFFRKKY